MIKNLLFKKIFSAITILTLILNVTWPVALGPNVYAQEVVEPVAEQPVESTTPAPTEQPSATDPVPTEQPSQPSEPAPEPATETNTEPVVDVTPIPSQTPVSSEEPPAIPQDQPSSSPEPLPDVNAEPSPSAILEAVPQESTSATPVWGNEDNGSFTTSNNVVLDTEYNAPQNDKVRVKFTKLPDPSGVLTVKEIKLSEQQIDETGALSDTAYEITSTMADGTFLYDLTLPLPPEAAGKDIVVEAAESLDQLAGAQTVSEPKEETADTITILGLNHFTVFIITAPSPDSAQPLLINEVVPNPSAGAEWIELFNNSAATIDLAAGTGWTIENSAGNTQSLSGLGTVLAGARVVFDAPAGWLSNIGPETITLSNDTGTPVDTVTISLTSPGFAINHYPALGESVGRRTDGHSEWIIFTVPTRGTPNTLAAPGARAVASTIEAHGYPTWYSDDNGTRVAACLDGADPRCAMAGEAGFDPANPTVLPGNFPSEFFYWSAEALMDTPGGRARLVLADEGAFLNDVVAEGDQMVFGRIRVRADGLVPNSDYTITHPYGSMVIQTDGTGELRSDGDDIGCEVAPCDFAAALQSPVFESFIRWDSGAPAGYLGDGVTEHTVTGSPTGNNFFKIEGPGLPAGGIQTSSFVVLGKLFVDPVTPPPGCVDIAPDAPLLAGPVDGATEVATSPTLTWSAGASFGLNCLGNNNQFEIFLDAGDVDPTTSWGNVSEATLSKLILGLAGDTTYSWKIRAKNGALFTDSAVQTFTTAVSAASNRAVSASFRADDGFPTWYRDDNGITVEPCLDGSDPLCAASLPPLGEEPNWNPNLPTDFPDDLADTTFNFPSEFFYWTAESAIESGGVSVLLILADEGAFLNEDPAPGDQAVFGRIRVRGDGLLPNTTYTITHPYGQDLHTTNEFGALRPSPNTEDIGCAASLCDFSLALGSRIFGGFLRQPAAPDGYLGDGISFLPVIGSPLNQNFFRIEGPGLPDGGLQSNLFAVSGKVFIPTTPPPGCEDTAPDQPQLANPANGAIEVSTNPLISWNALASFGTNCLGGRDQFEIFLDEGVVADPLTSRGTVLGTQTSFTVLNLLPNTTYSWKVRASNTALSTDSVVRTFTTTASTANKAVSATNDPDSGFPDWYRDDLGASVVPCLDGADPNCVLPAAGEEPGFDPTQPTTLPGNFPSEFFYWIAESDPLATPGGGDVDIRYAVEGAFLAEEPIPGDQMVFGRIRVRATGLLPNSEYSVTHAYGVDTYNTDVNGNITSVLGTEDIGCEIGPCDFTLALNSRIFGGFLRSVAGAPVGYLGDGATFSEVTGSPLGQNFFRIEGPGLPEGGLQTNLFAVSGKLLEVVPPGPDVTAPILSSFSSTTADGTYGPGAEINITANFNEPLAAGSTTIVTLDNTVPIELVQLSLSSTTLVGTYTVGALGSGEDSPDLTVAAITLMNATDLSGNLQTSTVLPVSNIADISDIVINTTTPIPPPVTTGTITVIKDAVPDDVQDFGFRMRNGPFDESFTLDDDSNNANELSNTILFADLAPGSYDLQETSLGSFVLNSISCPDPDGGTTIDLASRTATIDLDAGEAITCTFTNSLRNSISGMKFRDLNGNGVKEAGEGGLSGWTIFLDENDNTVLDGGEPSVVTDAGGNYQFIDVAGGTQNVREVLQAGWLQTLPESGKYTVVVANNSFINQDFGNILTTEVFGGSFALSGDDEDSTSQIVALEDITVEIPTNGGTTTIIIPAGTVITRTDGGDFDPSTLLASDADESLLSGFASGVVVDGVLQFGIPTLGLSFSQPITVNFFVGTAFNGQTLNIQRSVSGTSGWTSDGIVAPASCTVSAGICSFQATLASFYAATHTEEPAPAPAPAPAAGSGDGGGGGGGGGGGSASAPSCDDPAAGGAPSLLSAIVTGANQVTLTWSKAADPVTHYVLVYGLTSGNPLFGNPNVGGKDTISYTVGNLSGGTTYFFQVRAGNGCNAGPYSNELSATAGGGVVTGPATGFTEGVLGAQVGGAQGDENTGTGTGGPIIEESPSPSPEVLGAGEGNVGIGTDTLGQQAGRPSFFGFLQTQRLIVGILAGLMLLFVLNLYFRRAS